jgi:hypothetical protein
MLKFCFKEKVFYLCLFLLSIIFLFYFNKNNNIKLSALPYDKKLNNYALLFTMTDESGRTKNLQLMEDSFSDGLLGFEPVKFHNLSSIEIYKKLKEYTPLVGEKGTLLIYVNSHGGGSGKSFSMTARDGNFKFSKAINSIAESGRIKRLIFLIDTCHAAGGIEEGFKKKGDPLRVFNLDVKMPEITKDSWFRNFFELKNNDIDYCLDLNVFDEALILASSSAEKLTIRGFFSLSWKKTKEQIGRDCTVAEFLKTFAKNSIELGQQPYFKCLPNNSIFNEPLFENPISRELFINGKKNNLILMPDYN